MEAFKKKMSNEHVFKWRTVTNVLKILITHFVSNLNSECNQKQTSRAATTTSELSGHSIVLDDLWDWMKFQSAADINDETRLSERLSCPGWRNLKTCRLCVSVATLANGNFILGVWEPFWPTTANSSAGRKSPLSAVTAADDVTMDRQWVKFPPDRHTLSLASCHGTAAPSKFNQQIPPPRVAIMATAVRWIALSTCTTYCY